MQRLANVEEFLDGVLDDRRALSGNLRDLRRINRLLGGIRLSEQAIAALLDRDHREGPHAGSPELPLSTAHGSPELGPTSGGSDASASTAGVPGGIRSSPSGPNPGSPAARAQPASVLDVGCGAGDIALALVDRARRAGRSLRAVAVDSRPEVIQAAVALEPRLAGGDVEMRVADGRQLPFPDRSFDVAHVSMVIHHLEPPDAVGLLAELRRVARRGVVVNDLARSRAAVVGAWLMGHLLTTNRYTRNDAPLSVRRSYRPDEMRSLLLAAELRPVFMASALRAHRYVFAAVPDPRTTDHGRPGGQVALTGPGPGETR